MDRSKQKDDHLSNISKRVEMIAANCVLIIDEMNTGNLFSIFGDLLDDTVIEKNQ